ncbi:MAG: dihydroorotate dehydrogenase electron transfer subunit [Thermoguttaceae bacterium]
MGDPRQSAASGNYAWQETVPILENVPVARDTYRVTFRCPEIARRILPGQFVMVRLAGQNDPLLGRPLAMYDVLPAGAGEPDSLAIVYQAVGKMTRRLCALAQDTRLEVWGPLGNGFPPTRTDHLVMAAGGIGQTPFLALARESLGQRQYGDPPREVPRARQVTLCYGARTAEYLACVDDFRRAGVEVHLSTDDGSMGHCGPVTDLVRLVVGTSTLPCRVVACGPERMLAATAELARRLGVPCQVSLESPMACGIGICFSCVAKIRDASGQWDYRRICVEGPIFDAADVEF